MPRREGWDYAQLRTSFAGDPEFLRLARAAADDLHFLAAVGLWSIALAHAWGTDDPLVGDVLDSFDVPSVRALLGRDLVNGGGSLRGFEKWTAEARAGREAAREQARLRQRAWRSRNAPSRRVTRDAALVTPRNGVSRPVTPKGEGEGEGERAPDGAPKKVGKPTPRSRLVAWLREHGAGEPNGWANGALNELVRVYGPDAIVDCWEGAPEEVKTSRQYVQLAERVLSPAPSVRRSAGAKGFGPSREEIANAFDS